MLTWGQAKTQLARTVAGGVSPLDPRVSLRLNEACQRLFSATDFKGKHERYAFCTESGCITLPRHLETVLAVDVDGFKYNIRNDWFEFIEGGPGTMCPDSYNITALIDRGDGWPGFRDVTGNCPLRVYADLPEDTAAKLLVQGVNADKNEVMTMRDGIWEMGEKIPIANTGPSLSQTVFSKVKSYEKPLTTGFVRVYQVQPDVPESDVTTYAPQATMNIAATYVGELNDAVYYMQLMRDGDEVSGFTSINLFRDPECTDGLLMVASLDEGPDTVDTFGPQVLSAPLNGITAIGLVITNLKSLGTVMTPTVFTVTRDYTPLSAGPQSCIAILHPDETVPSLRRYLVPGLEKEKTHRVVALCQRRWVPLKRDSDLVYPGNLGALKHMLLALEKEEKNDLQAAATHEQQAIRILKQELRMHLGPTGGMQFQIRGGVEPWCQMR